MENIPFTAGHEAEAKSFLVGYRGAWFRCKIREITMKKRILGHISEYYDYPDEEVKWEKLYLVPPYMGNAKQKHRELMLRPRYPPIYKEKHMPNVSEVSEVIVSICGSWKVGDLVDWWNSDCFWSGRITELLNDQEVQIELKLPPLGEGSSYRVNIKDLRPSLDWSPEHGWRIPIQERGSGHFCARLIKPINEAIGKALHVEGTGVAIYGNEVVQRPTKLTSGFPLCFPIFSNSSASSEVKSNKMVMSDKSVLGTTFSKEQIDGIDKCASQRRPDSNTRKRIRSYANLSKVIVEEAIEVAKDDLNTKKYRCSERPSGGAHNSKCSGTIEATILDLEECLNKVKWLRKTLVHGTSSSKNMRRQWKFVEPRVSQAPK